MQFNTKNGQLTILSSNTIAINKFHDKKIKHEKIHYHDYNAHIHIHLPWPSLKDCLFAVYLLMF